MPPSQRIKLGGSLNARRSAAAQIAGRALRKYFRTPGLFVMGMVQAAMFLFSFRYVFGGAIQAGAGASLAVSCALDPLRGRGSGRGKAGEASLRARVEPSLAAGDEPGTSGN